MNRFLAVAASLALLSACGKGAESPSGSPAPSGPRPEKMPNGEPAAITVKHVLVAFEGASRSQQKRSKAEAERLAYDLLGRAKSGEDFDKLMKEYSSDPGGGTYAMVNDGVQGVGEEMGRRNMVAAFGDVGFRIALNEVALAEHDPVKSPFGYHVIKRVK